MSLTDGDENGFWRRRDVFVAGVVLAVFLVAQVWLRPHSKARQREPPYINSRIPFIGHIIGMMRYGAKYFDIVNKEKRHPVFTLPMLSTRNYIVSDATLAGHIQRNNKTLSFYALIVEVTRRIIAFDKNAARISTHNMDGEHGPGGLMPAVHEMMNRLLAPGPALDAITALQMEHFTSMLNSAVPPHGDAIVANLYAWQRHVLSLCNAYAIYGPENAFAVQPELEEDFWTFEDGMLGLVVDIVPSITARTAHFARKRVLDGLIEYVRHERYKKACPLIQERVQTNLAFGMSKEMAGHAELILMFGIMGNAVPSNFWLLSHLFSRPDLLERIRSELELALDLSSPADGRKEMTVSIAAKRINIKSCPLLYSCYREALRDISLLTSARMVMKDTLIPSDATGDKGEYLLRANSIVQIAGGVIHQEPSIWGEDADEFNPERFLVKQAGNYTSTSRTALPLPPGVPSSAFRAYGGGTVICPGRHFAQTELMLFAAVLALGFDIFEADGATLKVPPKDDTRIPLSVMKPTYDPRVQIRRRQGWEAVRWEVGL
ncbi:cytochrome P450 [Neohortaea acidophila]|uniref:Cytochrome P450 n=1 Tax=Neohortaea acidophila TaxID=245834 RepID=A0A6A6PVB9_9PEZI|nr:cytochrome P450 [Neohortaea acidophila]KAF2483207.1 cytochrome P450 [Neohortaea acidophila]